LEDFKIHPVAAPISSRQAAIAALCYDNVDYSPPDGRINFWFDLLFEPKQIRQRWPDRSQHSRQQPPSKKKPTPGRDQKLVQFHSQIVATVRRKWPPPSDRPTISSMAEQLAKDPVLKGYGFSSETIRKMLAGSYEPFLRLGLEPFHWD
jgi:hypothetical protein